MEVLEEWTCVATLLHKFTYSYSLALINVYTR
jgi:hypothetical protein